ncbi:hypothetical protein GUJ93_ZPchr0010g9922 [Zizania palustris]|uniref:Uncharacterized protein n=1 Tax=Zizania palustris TaxID=103762 RepID=A0A8J5W924_ZIZPA|nr:hypothetical protein GUJ93_ZPchr0010g9922 [Zizania palustris]
MGANKRKKLVSDKRRGPLDHVQEWPAGSSSAHGVASGDRFEMPRPPMADRTAATAPRGRRHVTGHVKISARAAPAG